MNPRVREQPEITLLSPAGKVVRRSEYFGCPEVIVIGNSGVSFDGWVFRTDADISESDLKWLVHQLGIVQATQGAERAGALVVALDRLLCTPGGIHDSAYAPQQGRHGKLPATGQLPTPFCISPDGIPVNADEELPELPFPKTMIVGHNSLLVDGWHFRIWPINRSHLEWLVRKACRWREADPSPESRAQINGVVEAMEPIFTKADV